MTHDALSAAGATATPAALLRAAAKRYGQKPALSFLGAAISFEETERQAARVARILRAMGATEGTRVMLLAPNSPAFVFAYFGALRLGCTLTPANPAAHLSELRHMARDSGAVLCLCVNLNVITDKVRALLHDPENALRQGLVFDFSDPMPPLKRALFRLTQGRLLGKRTDDPALLHVGSAPEQAGEDAPDLKERPALLQYTGGATGSPKGVLLTGGALMANAEQCSLRLGTSLPEGGACAGLLPLFHMFALTAVLHLGLRRGLSVRLYPRPDIPALLRDIHTGHVNMLAAAPALLAKIAAHPYAKRCSYDALAFSVSGGAPLPAALKKRFEALTGRPVAEGYGLTEASPMLTFTAPVPQETARACAGTPLDGTEVRICTPGGRPLAAGEQGEIRAKGPQLMSRYCGAAAAEEQVFDQDGFFKTGDVGYLDQDGFLHISGRMKDLIIVSGDHVYPREVEEAISRCEGVYEAAVFGVEDERTGQRVAACVQPSEGSRVNAEILRDALKETLTQDKIPEHILFLPSLPKTTIGNPDKASLATKWKEAFGTDPTKNA